MSRFLILGGYGYTGKLLARHLLERSQAQVVLAGRHLEKAQSYADELNTQYPGQRASGLHADAASRDDLLQALQGVEMLVVAAPTTQYAQTVIQAALQAGVDYLDVQLDAHKLAVLQAHAQEIEQAGRCFITEAGFHPGLPSAMVRFAATHIERLESAIVSGYLNMGQALPYSEAVDELMEAFKDYQGQVYKDRRWGKPGSYSMRKVDFGSEIGTRNCFSMFFEELRPLPEMYPALRELGFYMSGTHWIVDWVITGLVFAGLKIAPKRGVRPLGRLMWWGMQTFTKPPYLVLLKVEASGEAGGQPVRVETSVSHPDGYELTAIPVVATLLQYLDGSARRPGLWMMGHLAEPARLFQDMQQMGVRISTNVG